MIKLKWIVFFLICFEIGNFCPASALIPSAHAGACFSGPASDLKKKINKISRSIPETEKYLRDNQNQLLMASQEHIRGLLEVRKIALQIYQDQLVSLEIEAEIKKLVKKIEDKQFILHLTNSDEREGSYTQTQLVRYRSKLAAQERNLAAVNARMSSKVYEPYYITLKNRVVNNLHSNQPSIPSGPNNANGLASPSSVAAH